MKKKDLKILVTGGGGFLGSAIVRELVSNGESVTSFSRKRYPALSDLGVRQICGDLTERSSVLDAVMGVDLVFHVAAKPGIWGDYAGYFKANVLGTQHIIDACIKHKVSRLVYTSSPSVVFDGNDMEGVNESTPYPEKYHAFYPQTKAMAEKLVMAAGNDTLKTVCLRPHLIWGPGDNHLVPRILAKSDRLVRIGKKKNLVDTIYIDNAAHAHILAAKSLVEKKHISGRAYFISQDDPIPIWDMINAILHAGGKPPVTRTLPHGVVRTVGLLMEIAYKIFKIKDEPPMTRFVADELATAHWFDMDAAKKDLGYFPEISTKEGLARLKDSL